MHEIPKKGAKDFLRKIVDGLKKEEANFSGSVGSAANSAADFIQKRLKGPTAAKPPKGFTDADYDKMVKGGAWQDNTINIKKSGWNETPAQKAHHTKMAMDGNADKIGDHVPNKELYLSMKDKIKKTTQGWREKETANMKGEFVTLKKKGYTGNEIDTGRAIITTSAIGGAVGDAIGYATDPVKEEPKHFMSKEITSQKEANGYWTRQKNGGNK